MVQVAAGAFTAVRLAWMGRKAIETLRVAT
jgi:hypothetical protein